MENLVSKCGSDGSLPGPHYLSKVLQHIAKTTNLRRTCLHDLWHTYVKLQRKANLPAEIISKALGHTSALVALEVYNYWEQ